MCLSVPARVISICGQRAEVEVYGERRQVFLACDPPQAGDWVLLYSGMALTVLDKEAAKETLDLLSRMHG